MARFRPMLQGHGITDQQWRVIRVLAEAEEIDVTSLAQRSFILGPSLSRILKTLEGQDLVRKRRDEADGRVYWLRLTDRGQELLAKVRPDSERIYGELLETLGPERVDTLLEVLRDFTDRIGQSEGQAR